MITKPGLADRTDRSAGPAETFRAGLVFRQQGKQREADQLFQAVLKSDTRHFGALYSLAALRLEHGAAAEGLAFIERALRLQPNSAPALHLQACLLQQLGRIADAIVSYQKAIHSDPEFAEAYSNLGGLYSEQRRYQAALARYEKALRVRPNFPELHNNMGVALLALSRPVEALEHFAQAIAQKPDFADALGNQGSALISLGRIAEASEAFEQAVRLAPRNGKFYLDLARCKKFSPDDSTFAAMENLAKNPVGLSAEARTELHFALGKAFSDLGRTEELFRHFRQGNALKRVNIVYHEAETLGMMERIRSVFTTELISQRAQAGDSSPVPVFVVGMPRSGTTLVEQIIASHPKVFGAGERPELQQTAMSFAEEVKNSAALFDVLASLPDERLRQLGADYVQSIKELAPEADRIVDKMPGNFLYVGLIALSLPNARVIHVRRDPVDTCLSCFCTLFSGHQPYAYNLGELGRVLPGLCGADGALAVSDLAPPAARGGLRKFGGRHRRPGAANARALRPHLGRAVPGFSQDRACRPDGEQGASAPALVSKLDRACPSLWADARAADPGSQPGSMRLPAPVSAGTDRGVSMARVRTGEEARGLGGKHRATGAGRNLARRLDSATRARIGAPHRGAGSVKTAMTILPKPLAPKLMISRPLVLRLLAYVAPVAILFPLAACGNSKYLAADQYNDPRYRGPGFGHLSGDNTLFTTAHSNGAGPNDQGGALGVNAYLWRGALDTLSFMPLASADPFGGVIITDWYQPPGASAERFKATAYILGRQLRADGVRVAIFRQTLDGGQWVDAPVSPSTSAEIEDKVLARARELRAQSAER